MTILRFDGTTWTTIQTPTSAPLGPGWARSPSDLYILEDRALSGTVWHFDGTDWSQLVVGGDGLYDIWGSPSGDIFVAGRSGLILHGR
jgi:hypothetical protein